MSTVTKRCRHKSAAAEFDELSALAIKPLRAWHATGMDLVGSVLADPSLVRMAIAAGVRARTLPMDLRIIWIAAAIGARESWPLIPTLRLAMLGLRGESLWDDEETACGPLWGYASLSALAYSWFPWPAAVRNNSRRLIVAYERVRQADIAMRRARGLLDGSIEPDDVHSFDRIAERAA